jgi:hypothetical protein
MTWVLLLGGKPLNSKLSHREQSPENMADSSGLSTFWANACLIQAGRTLSGASGNGTQR